jgi:hypothetical protein
MTTVSTAPVLPAAPLPCWSYTTTAGLSGPPPTARQPRVYVAGPYTQGDVAENVRAAILAADWLAQQGCVPFCPHLSHFWHLLNPHPYEFWLAQDLAWLAVCDALVRLPGPSAGADGEVAEARRLGLPVFWAPEDRGPCKEFDAWRRGWGE